MSADDQVKDTENGLLKPFTSIKSKSSAINFLTPAVMFAGLLVIVLDSEPNFLPNLITSEIDPRTGSEIVVNNLLAPGALANFLATMVTTFTSFAPLGVVLVAMLGIGVAERSGFINVGIKLLLNNTAKFLLTPILILVAIVSHTAVDAGYVLVIPLGGIIFYAAGRHPLAGIAAAFAGVCRVVSLRTLYRAPLTQCCKGLPKKLRVSMTQPFC